LPRVKAFPQVRGLLERLRGEGYGIALATSCASDELKHYVELAGIADLLDAVACGEDVKREKPHPDLIEVALSRAHSPAHATMVGDTPYDAMAARAAGVMAFGVLTGGFTREALKEAGCVAVYADPADARG
jgi:HAD superfamily hydrolase (TIGR01549 family)